ncbi:unnamed protein product [Soboliphyme baturini]|uniref:MHD domain-containing protein n=1 Tax=Soboliphyme baturini TaxID=241478 RepID=A0A183J021_9BILA|nr:unnamed protein product [Soboliphyme baturini]
MLDIGQLLDGFVEANQTGIDKPPVMEFEEPETTAFVAVNSCVEPSVSVIDADTIENSSSVANGGGVGEAGSTTFPSSLSHFKLPQTVSKGKLTLWLPGRKAGRRNGPVKDTASEGSGSVDSCEKCENAPTIDLGVQGVQVSRQDDVPSKPAVQSQLPPNDQDAMPRRILSMGFLKKKSREKRFDKGSKEMIANAFAAPIVDEVINEACPDEPSSSLKVPSTPRTKSGSFSDSDSDDEMPSKIKLEIKPPLSDRRKVCASVDELKDVVESMSSNIKNANRSLEIVPSSRPLKAMVLRPAKTGDDRWNNLAFAGNLSNFSNSSVSLERRLRPRSTTPTHMMILGSSSGRQGQPGLESMSPTDSERPFAERQNSLGSIPEFSGAASSAGTAASRGPSPVSSCVTDRIPLAVAVTETIHVLFKSSNECAVRTFGNVTFSFPAGIMKILSSTSPSELSQLSFGFESAERIQGIIGNRKILDDFNYSGSCSKYKFDFNMNSLAEHLKLLNRRNPSAPFYNLEVLRYEVMPKAPSESQSKDTAAVVPLLLRSFWKCFNDHTDLCISYSYNPDCRLSAPLINLLYSIKTDGSVCSVTSKPEASW